MAADITTTTTVTNAHTAELALERAETVLRTARTNLHTARQSGIAHAHLAAVVSVSAAVDAVLPVLADMEQWGRTVLPVLQQRAKAEAAAEAAAAAAKPAPAPTAPPVVRETQRVAPAAPKPQPTRSQTDTAKAATKAAVQVSAARTTPATGTATLPKPTPPAAKPTALSPKPTPAAPKAAKLTRRQLVARVAAVNGLCRTVQGYTELRLNASTPDMVAHLSRWTATARDAAARFLTVTA